MSTTVSRRQFVGGLAATLGTFGAVRFDARTGARVQAPATSAPPRQMTIDEYDAAAKLAFNENPYGPSESVVKAMASAHRFWSRYGYPDADILDEIATHHGVAPENVILGAGSSEVLEVAGRTFLPGGRKIVGVQPTFADVYQYASGVRAESIILPLRDDATQDVDALARATRANHRDVAFVYLCTPNNPTGVVVTKQDVRRLLDNVPDDVPVLIDEAYHHYVAHPEYASAIPYVLEGRNVIVARTFSKVYGLAGMRLGYAIAPASLVRRMRPHTTGSINALVKWAGAAALKDTAAMKRTRDTTVALRKKTTTELQKRGYTVLPSETNFFMVHLGREVGPVIQAFRSRGILVGRPFPPMTQHLRVSVGLPEEMDRFIAAFGEIV